MNQTAFIHYLRLDPDEFSNLINRISCEIRHDGTHISPITPSQRLAVFLRWAGHAQSFTSLTSEFTMGRSTISCIVAEVSEAINRVLFAEAFPKLTAGDLKQISEGFQCKYDYPVAVGAIDGKHVAIKKPANSGSNYFNYKHFFSIVLLAIVDCEYRFMFFDVGSPGKNSDGRVYTDSKIKQYFDSHDELFPEDQELPGQGRMPYHFLCDGGFGMTKRFIRPFTQDNCRNNSKRRHFNKKLSGARRIVESAFGILAQRFRILSTTISLSPEDVSRTVTTLMILHNMLRRRQDSLEYSVRCGHFDRGTTYSNYQQVSSNSVSVAGKHIREKLVEYFALKDNIS